MGSAHAPQFRRSAPFRASSCCSTRASPLRYPDLARGPTRSDRRKGARRYAPVKRSKNHVRVCARCATHWCFAAKLPARPEGLRSVPRSPAGTEHLLHVAPQCRGHKLLPACVPASLAAQTRPAARAAASDLPCNREAAPALLAERALDLNDRLAPILRNATHRFQRRPGKKCRVLEARADRCASAPARAR